MQDVIYLFFVCLFTFMRVEECRCSSSRLNQFSTKQVVSQSVDPLDELLLHHAVEGNVGQV